MKTFRIALLPSGWVGVALVMLVAGIGILGPLGSPYSPTEIVDLPFNAPSWAHPLGTDVLGRDALSRFLNGGRTLIAVAMIATVLAYSIGVCFGMMAGYRRRRLDLAIVGLSDLMLSFPPIVFVLVLVAAAGTMLSVTIIGIAAIHTPRIIRIVRSVTIEIVAQEYVEAAIIRGEGLFSILVHDILPNIRMPVLADFGIRLTGSVILFSGLSYLGLGPQPPAADWGLMVSENQTGLLLQSWTVAAPAAAIALLAIGMNLVADAIARGMGNAVVARGV